MRKYIMFIILLQTRLFFTFFSTWNYNFTEFKLLIIINNSCDLSSTQGGFPFIGLKSLKYFIKPLGLSENL